MLLKNLYSVKGISSDGISYEKDENTTLLSSVFSIYYDFGTVEAVYGCSMNTTTVMYYKNIQINGNEYDVSHSFDESGLCGSYVKYFIPKRMEEEKLFLLVKRIMEKMKLVLILNCIKDMMGVL